ncbi:type VII toxin-antitoxin system MntA family adenylyltransferase antitoxin [Gracilinema caldarium]|uniref:DNA polymerase beta domain protein region n=1 Tax=Gracilinema caldarium (strain ATCC 51460 / DSM 7334 / H1) TaxID=744872 RepID=F8F014_GRAC1|nr:nucleotidyltransferase domain-containing protein [Gracilinema caldarium]AEJ18667.1 DNA polymerase beta domain protein region [Gracilinema caldarium DSM 7334]
MTTVDVLINSLCKAIEGFPGLRFAVLFGSRARGEARDTSDVDIGLSFLSPPPLLQLGGMVSALEEATGIPVDIVELDGLASRNPLLAYKIATEGLLLAEREPGAFDAFRALAYSMYFDAEPFLEAVRATLSERIRTGNFARPNHA